MLPPSTLNDRQTRRTRAFGLALLVAIGLTGIGWYWNRAVSSPDPAILVRTDQEAAAAGLTFLAKAQVNTTNYDLAHAVNIARDRLKGQVVWRVCWLPKADVPVTSALVVLVFEKGWFYTDEMTGTNEGTAIEGYLDDISRKHFQ